MTDIVVPEKKSAELSSDGSANGVCGQSNDERIVKIEKALSGLTIEDAQYLLRKVNKSLTSKSLVSA